MDAQHPSLTVSILVHRNFEYIHHTLQSVYETTDVALKVYVVINAGTEADTQALMQAFPQAEFIVNKQPQGFAANHNKVMRLAQTPYVALLNDDIVLHDNALGILTHHLQAHVNIGVVGGQLMWGDGKPQVSIYSDPSLGRMIYKISGIASLTSQHSRLRRWVIRAGLFKSVASFQQNTQIRTVAVIKGAVMVVRREAYEHIGLMSEVTRAYGEEIDWHWRFRRAGWQVVIVPQARITHYGTGQAKLRLQGWLLREDRKSILNYYLNHRPSWQAIVIRLSIIFFHGIWSIIWLLLLQIDRAVAHFDTVKMGLTWKTQSS